MDLIQSLTSIGKYSGDFFWYRRTAVSEGGVITAAEANWHAGVWRIADDISFDRKSEKVFSASGKLLVTEEGESESSIVVTSAQFDANFIQFVKNEARNATFELFFDAGKGYQKKYLEIYVPNAMFMSKMSSKSGTRKPELEISVLSNLAARTPAADSGGTALPSGAHGVAANFLCGIDELFTPYETA